jgi:hypothetical protein
MTSSSENIEVIIPVRGAAPWLSLSLASIAAQTVSPIRITVIDDGAELANDVREFGTRLFAGRFQFFQNPGRGISAALNAGIKQSKAQWIARMDADDVAHPDRLRKQWEFLTESCDNVLGCGTQVKFVNRHGRALGHSRLPTSWEGISRQIRSRTCFVHSSLMMRREMLVRTPYRSGLDGAEDVDLALRLAEKGRILNLNEALLDYRIHFTQESFLMRARHTAAQELAFRLAACRERTHRDPLDLQPELAEEFIRWRLSTPGYVRARTSLTALRYMGIHLLGRDFWGVARCARIGLKSLPITPASFDIAWRVCQKAGAGLVDKHTPFEALNSRCKGS